MCKPRVLVIDDHPVFRWGMRRVFERIESFELVGEAADGNAALAAIRADSPDIVLLDLDMPGLDGPGLLRALAGEGLTPKIVILSQALDDSYLQALLDFGVSGCVLKTEDTSEITRALERVAGGETYFSPKASGYLWKLLRARALQPCSEAPPVLSPREKEVATLISRGMAAKDIALALGCSTNTIRCHRANIMRKIGAKNRVEIMTYVVRNRELN